MTVIGVDSDEQLQKWLDGEPVHVGGKDTGQCCPDFSCCVPGLLAPAEERGAFCRADDEAQHAMLMIFLARAVNRMRGRGRAAVYVAGLDTPKDVQ